METITPYTDEKLVYNTTTNTYELDLEWVKNNLGNTYRDDGVLQLRIKKNTRKVMQYIYSHSYSANRKIINAIITHTQEYRDYIYDALFSQMEADMASGYNDNDMYVPDTKDNRNLQFVNEVSVATQNILESGIGYGGINILYMGVFNYSIYLQFMEYAQ